MVRRLAVISSPFSPSPRVAPRTKRPFSYTREALTRWVELPAHPLERIEKLEQLRPLAAGWAIGVALIAGPLRRGIDTENDLARANSEWTIFSGEPA